MMRVTMTKTMQIRMTLMTQVNITMSITIIVGADVYDNGRYDYMRIAMDGRMDGAIDTRSVARHAHMKKEAKPANSKRKTGAIRQHLSGNCRVQVVKHQLCTCSATTRLLSLQSRHVKLLTHGACPITGQSLQTRGNGGVDLNQDQTNQSQEQPTTPTHKAQSQRPNQPPPPTHATNGH